MADLLHQPVPKQWCEVADGLKIPFDEASQFHPEYDGYVKGESLLNDPSRSTAGLSVVGGGLTGQLVKQADTVMLGYPLGFPMTPEVRKNDLEVYEPLTDPNGPAMTWVRAPVCPSVCLSLCLSIIYLSVYLPTYLPTCLSFCLSVFITHHLYF